MRLILPIQKSLWRKYGVEWDLCRGVWIVGVQIMACFGKFVSFIISCDVRVSPDFVYCEDVGLLL